MKPLLALFLACLLLPFGKAFAQVKTYEAQWKKVDGLIEKKSLPATALAEVKKIFALAKKEGQEAQVIKSLVYISTLQSNTRENNEILSIREIEAALTQQKEPVVSLLKSLLARKQWAYLQEHRYQLHTRSNTDNFSKPDIATWTQNDFQRSISALYLASIANGTILKTFRLSDYDAIIDKGNLRQLRPTLYDLLAQEALVYFKAEAYDATFPAYAFEITQPQAFAPAATFARYRFAAEDSISLLYKSVIIYQDLLRFHANDARRDAFVDADIDRIQFVYRSAVLENKDSLYVRALRRIADDDPGAVSVKARYLLANWYWQQSDASANPDQKKTEYRRTAKDMLADIVRDSTVKTESWYDSRNTLNEITEKEISFKVEEVNLPGQPFRTLIRYRNSPVAYLRVIRADEALMKKLEAAEDSDETDAFWKLLGRTAPLKSWSQALPASEDLMPHSAEVKVDALTPGRYYLFVSTDPKFATGKVSMAAKLVHVSSISYVNKGKKYFVLHRETGRPLAGAGVTIYRYEYIPKTSKYGKVRKASLKTDGNGQFDLSAIKTEGESGPLLFDITHGNDRLFVDELSYHYYYGDDEPEVETAPPRIFFFTDRSIYRPGQTVYFKGIAVNGNDGAASIATGFRTTVYLRNANGEDADSMSVTTNDFGSFNGKFRLPQQVLNGAFFIGDEESNRVGFSVEEYKRPKFYVDFDPIKNGYRVKETVTVQGRARAYAGNSIGGAKVSYRVVRQPRLILPLQFSRYWYPPTQSMEIAHGEAVTDKDGGFTIRFTAIPDPKIDSSFNPSFDYEVYADVTDINGETKSASKTFSAGYQSIVLSLSVPATISTDSSAGAVGIAVRNRNGEFQSASLQVTLSQLKPEQRLIRQRYWDQPDQFVMTKEDYIRNFPHDEYADETDRRTWPKQELRQQTDTARNDGRFTWNGGRPLAPGIYELSVTAMAADGSVVRELAYMEVFDPASSRLAQPQYLWTMGTETPLAPGEAATLRIGSSASDVFLVREVERWQQGSGKGSERISTLDFSNIGNERKTVTLPIAESDRGGFGISFFFVKDNRFYDFTDDVQVPWTNKQLDVVYTSFRDKTLPGSGETWKVQIKGSKGEKFAAEMLAGMYDASLDQFRPHDWELPSLWPVYSSNQEWTGEHFKAVEGDERPADGDRLYTDFSYDRLAFDLDDLQRTARRQYRGNYQRIELTKFTPPSIKKDEEIRAYRAGEDRKDGRAYSMAAPSFGSVGLVGNGAGYYKRETFMLGWETEEKTSDGSSSHPVVALRRNLNETAFFFPDLHTDAEGNIEFSFTAPEALTRWKLQTLAHTKDLSFGLSKKEMVTQKELMVQPNLPRTLRQGDRIELTVKIANLSSEELTGQARLELFDAATNNSVDGYFINAFPNQYFTVAAGGSEVVKFPVQVPFQFDGALTWRITASAGKFSDGEEATLPVLTSKVLVTESQPLFLRGNGSKTFDFTRLLNAGSSETLQHRSLTVEYTSSPVWYAVQALPYLMEYPFECAEQTWNRYYANALATHIVTAAPRIRQVFAQWKTLDTAALLSNLQKNGELKSVLLEETPWVLEAKSESERKKNIALLFDLVKMGEGLASNLDKLKEMQLSDGSFPWFRGGRGDRYITQYIVTGIGHLKQLGVNVEDLYGVLSSALAYLDKKIAEDDKALVRSKADHSKQQIGNTQLQYLYARSFFPEHPVPAATKTAYAYYKTQARQFWTKQGQFAKALTALALHRGGDKPTAEAILRSLKEGSIVSEELGRYWKENTYGRSWYWWQAPIETQSLMAEAFAEIPKDMTVVNEIRTWLIRNKQTRDWRTTKATADACYALLLRGANWLEAAPSVEMTAGDLVMNAATDKTESGSGYLSRTVKGSAVKPGMGHITVSVQGAGTMPSWGAVHWQYFEDADKVTSFATPLQLAKKLFVETNTDRGPVLTPVAEGAALKVGDKIKVRIELRVDRDMDYVHMKDMRASALEPANVLSGYQWQDGLGYYESTRDASTNFFFDLLRKGTYVFEYTLFVTHTGSFSNGITTIQCLYAPEFNAHSEGIRIDVE